LFFVLQALIYTACLVKLAEIRRQRVVPRIKLRLLENEEHLFDAGLYLGFAGTIISLILVSLGLIRPSLMAAYSSTSFGIIFVSIFKIFHLRPERRRLVLQSEIDAQAPKTPAPAHPLAAPL
jgi:formate-dependent nitrite reductase membrane component NrfD